MDLSSVISKIDLHKYLTVKDYLRDIDLICSNALEYNPDRDPGGEWRDALGHKWWGFLLLMRSPVATQTRAGQMGARSMELNLGLPCGWPRAPGTLAFSAVFPCH